MPETAGVPSFELTVDSPSNGVRIDSFLTRHLRNYSNWRIQRIARAGGIRVDFDRATETTRVFAGQQVTVRLLEPPDKLLEPESIPLSIIYEDNWIVVVNKPPGMVAHPVGTIQRGTLCNALQHHLDRRTEVCGILRPGIVHRLDRQTSGAMVVALTHDAHVALSTAFEASQISKTYLALVEGVIKERRGVINQPIGRAPIGRHVLMSCRPDAIRAKRSKTQFRVVERFSDHTLVAAKPVTGRNHQIRVHFAHLGFPLVGDEFYERNGKFKPFRSERTEGDNQKIETGLPIQRHALHAIQLELAHPIGGAWISLRADLSADFQETLNVLRNS